MTSFALPYSRVRPLGRALTIALLCVALTAPSALAAEPEHNHDGEHAEDEPEPIPPTEDSDGNLTYEQTVEITFPAPPSARFSHDYHAPRGGGTRVHRATDIIADKHSPAYAAIDGSVCHITGIDEDMPSWGYSLTICGIDGRRYRYIHMNNDTPGTDDGEGGPEHAYAEGIRRGTQVVAGQLVGYIGDSGNAENTVSHIHFEIFDSTVVDVYESDRIDPYPSLVAALEAGRVGDDSIQGPNFGDSDNGATRPAVNVERVAGSDRVATAVALSRSSFRRADHAIIAPADDPAAPLIAGPLAAVRNAPVLTTMPDAVDRRVLIEVERLRADAVSYVGVAPDQSAIGTRDLQSSAFTGNRYQLAADVADEVWRLTENRRRRRRSSQPRVAVLALGEHSDPSRSWPDSLLASWYGSVREVPVLLTAPDHLPGATRDALAEVDELIVVGGPAAISEELYSRIASATGGETTRLWGNSRYDTGLALADDLLDRGLVDDERVWMTTGSNWPDATAAASVVARDGGVLVLVDGQGANAGPSATAWLTERADNIATIRPIGGRVAIADAVVAALRTTLQAAAPALDPGDIA